MRLFENLKVAGGQLIHAVGGQERVEVCSTLTDILTNVVDP